MQRQQFIRTALRTAIGAAALALAASGFAQTYPAKAVRRWPAPRPMATPCCSVPPRM